MVKISSSPDRPTPESGAPVNYRSVTQERLLVGVIPVWRVSLWRALVWRVPVWRVAFWRGPSSARFSLARCQFGVFHFGAFPILVSMLIQYSRQFSFFSAKPSLARVAYLFVRMFPFSACFLRRNVVYEEVLSTPVCREATLLGLLWRAYYFLRIFPLFMRRIVCVIYLLIISTRHRATA